METPKLPEFSSEVGINVVENLEAHYRQLFNDSYAAAGSYAHILVTLHDLKGKLRKGHAQSNEVAELERWFNTELQRTDGRERPDGELGTNASAA